MDIELKFKKEDDGSLACAFVIPDEIARKIIGTDLNILESLINHYLDKI